LPIRPFVHSVSSLYRKIFQPVHSASQPVHVHCCVTLASFICLLSIDINFTMRFCKCIMFEHLNLISIDGSHNLALLHNVPLSRKYVYTDQPFNRSFSGSDKRAYDGYFKQANGTSALMVLTAVHYGPRREQRALRLTCMGCSLP